MQCREGERLGIKDGIRKKGLKHQHPKQLNRSQRNEVPFRIEITSTNKIPNQIPSKIQCENNRSRLFTPEAGSIVNASLPHIPRKPGVTA